MPLFSLSPSPPLHPPAQCIIFLKLLDGGNVSRLILGEVGVGCAIEGWKVSKIASRRGMMRAAYWRTPPPPPALPPPAISADGSGAAEPAAAAVAAVAPPLDAGAPPPMSAREAVSDAADARAMRVLCAGMVPILLCWGAYSLKYHSHRSWWSWLIKTAAHGVYLYGFVAMTPQLYINYRLKSVAHLPWRAMAYKTFNTFVDDVFAFAIEMPLSHRIACLRDDVIFFGYLYQRWIYPIDKTRPNEFGRAYDEEAAAEAAAQAALTSAADAADAAKEEEVRGGAAEAEAKAGAGGGDAAPRKEAQAGASAAAAADAAAAT
jgi:hypothetical protein